VVAYNLDLLWQPLMMSTVVKDSLQVLSSGKNTK